MGAAIVTLFVLLDFYILSILHLNKIKNRLIYNFNSLFYYQHPKQQQQHHQNARPY